MHTQLINFLVFISSLIALWPASLHANQMLCTSNQILIEGSRKENISAACDAVKGAAEFYRSTGISMPSNIVIKLESETSLPFQDMHEIGHYDALLHTIVIRDFQSSTSPKDQSKQELWSIDSRTFWQSYIVHELTHAAIQAGCGRNCPSRAVHEYVAAVAQISALPDEYRSRLLDNYRDLKAFENRSEITELYYAFNPHYFAVKSYKHFRKQTDPATYLQSMITPH